MNTVTVLIEGYIKAIEGRQLIPGVSADGARHVAGTVALIRGEQAVIVADPGMVTAGSTSLRPARQTFSGCSHS